MDPFSFDVGASPHRPGWMEFCDKHARTAAEDFLESFLVFLKAHPTSEFRPREPIDYARKFVELFLQHFERNLQKGAHGKNNETARKEAAVEGADTWLNQSENESRNSSINGINGPALIARSHNEENDSFNEDGSVHNEGIEHDHSDFPAETQNSSFASPALKSKGSILKRFSFRKIKQRGLFKQNSEEIELATGSSDNYLKEKHMNEQKQSKRNKRHHKESKYKLAHNLPHSVGEVKKEGVVYVLTGEDSKGKSRWEKTRLVLLKTDTSYMLEFYSPPKVIELKVKIICCMYFAGDTKYGHNRKYHKPLD